MILSISSTIPTFKTLTFGPGLSVLLADLTATSSDKQTRNSAGKTSAIEILHFLLGSEADKRSLFKKPEIIEHSFTARFRFERGDLEVTRIGVDDKKILIDRDQADHFGIVLTRDDESGREYVTLDEWKTFLGSTWFKLPRDRRGTDFEGSFTPSFRSLIAYFARRRKSGGYGAIQKQNASQQPWDSQVNLSYLIGLDWRIPRDIQDLQVRKKGIQNVKKAIKEGELGSIFGSSAEIRPEIVRTEERLAQLKARIDSFQVLDTYRETAAEVSALKIRMNAITLDLALADETITQLDKAISDEEPPPYASVERLYSEAGVQLPTVSLRRFDEVQEFQNSVVANRRKYLEQELEAARAEKRNLEAELADLDLYKARLLKLLEGKGALDDLMALHEEYATIKSRADQLRDKLRNANILENQVAQNRRDSAELELRLQDDHKANEAAINYATAKVDHAISELYDDRKGNLIVTPSKTGPKIEISIQGDGNLGGIDQMKIFCFDSMLFEVTSERWGARDFSVMTATFSTGSISDRSI